MKEYDFSYSDINFLIRAKEICERIPRSDWPEGDEQFYDAVCREIDKRNKRRKGNEKN